MNNDPSAALEKQSATLPKAAGVPASLHALCILQIIGGIGGAVWVLILTATAINKFGESDNNRSENVMGIFFLLAAFIGASVLILLFLSLWKTIKRRASLRGWGMSYALSSIVSKVVIFITYIIIYNMSIRFAMADLETANPFGMAFARSTIEDEISATRMQAIGLVFFVLLFASVLPSCVLFLTRAKGLKQFIDRDNIA